MKKVRIIDYLVLSPNHKFGFKSLLGLSVNELFRKPFECSNVFHHLMEAGHIFSFVIEHQGEEALVDLTAFLNGAAVHEEQ